MKRRDFLRGTATAAVASATVPAIGFGFVKGEPEPEPALTVGLFNGDPEYPINEVEFEGYERAKLEPVTGLPDQGQAFWECKKGDARITHYAIFHNGELLFSSVTIYAYKVSGGSTLTLNINLEYDYFTEEALRTIRENLA